MAYKHTFVCKSGLKTKELTAMKAVRQKCLECSAWSFSEVKACPATDCALWPFRLGRNPRASQKKGHQEGHFRPERREGV